MMAQPPVLDQATPAPAASSPSAPAAPEPQPMTTPVPVTTAASQPQPQPQPQPPLMRTASIYPPNWQPVVAAPEQVRAPSYGQRLALAISSLAIFWLMIATAIGAAQVFNAGFAGWLFVVVLLALVTLAVNLVFNLDVFGVRR